MADKKPLIIIAGATGVGKTETSIGLAKRIDGEIISADSMQIYKGFNIGTAKIKKEEMQGVRHHLIDICEPDENFNIYTFQKLANVAINEIHENGKVPIIVGGTGFYIQSVAYEIKFEEEPEEKAYRVYLEKLADEKGCDYMHNWLSEVDPDSANAIHKNNMKRVIRALEFYHENNSPISRHNREQSEKNSPYNLAYFVLDRSRENIYKRINIRVDKMFKEGLEAEIKTLLDKGVKECYQSMQGLGYKEMIPYFHGEYGIEDAKEKIKLGTRHFAKRQNTWFKREKDAIWINLDEFLSDEEIIENIINILGEKKIV